MRSLADGEEPAELRSACTGGTPVPTFSGTIQICDVFVFASRLTSTTLKSTHLPSGDGTGSPTRLSFIMSSNVNGRFACASAATEKRQTNTIAKKRRMKTSGTGQCSTGYDGWL